MESRTFDRLARLFAGAATRREGLGAVAGALVGASVQAVAGAGARKDRQGPEAAGPCGDGSVKDNRCRRNSQCCTRICDIELGKKNKDKRGRCRCLKNGKPCSSDLNCCKTSVCYQGSCTTCRRSGQACEDAGDCCGSDYCIAGVCQSCRPEASACSSTAECCDGFNCYNGACTECIAEGAACSNSSECCSGAVCREGACTLPQLVKTGDPCRADFDTCENPEATCTEYYFDEPSGTYCLLPRKAHCQRNADCVSRDCPGDICVDCTHEACITDCSPIVCKGLGCPHSTIQAAIDAADDGDVIDIGQGEYLEDLTIGKNLVLRACKGRPVTIQNRNYDARTITVTGPFSVALIDITVEALADLGNEQYGGGISTLGDLGLYRFSVVRNGVWPIGGGIMAGAWGLVDFVPGSQPASEEESSLKIDVRDQSVVEDNTAIVAGGGIFAGWNLEEFGTLKENGPDFGITISGSATIKDNTVLGQTLKPKSVTPQNGFPSQGGGGIWLYNGWVEVHDDGLLQNNRAENSSGGAMLVLPCNCDYSVLLDGNARCFRNRAKVGGGVAIANNTSVAVPFAGLWMEDNASIAENRVDSYGAGVVLRGVALRMTDNASIAKNISMGSAGGALIWGPNTQEDSYGLSMADNASISDNTAVTSVGGLMLLGAWGTLTGSATITRNRCEDDGGGVYLAPYEYDPFWKSGIVLNDSASITLNIAGNDDTGTGGGVFSSSTSGDVYGGDKITDNSPDNCVGSNSPSCVA